MNESTLPVSLTTGSARSFMNSAYGIPVLTMDEEQNLARRLREHGDLVAAETLVMSHMRFVISIARGYSGYGLPLPDLIQEGSVGLMKAVKRFDPVLGVRLVSFAVHWIRAEIHEFVLKNWRIVKVATTKAQRKLFFNLRSSKKSLGWLTRDEAEHIAGELNVKPETVLQMEARMSNHDVAFDDGDQDEDEARLAPSGFIADTRMEPAKSFEEQDTSHRQRERLNGAMCLLDERSCHIIQARWLGEKKQTLQQLGRRFGVSAERIRQIEKSAIQRLKAHMV